MVIRLYSKPKRESLDMDLERTVFPVWLESILELQNYIYPMTFS